MLSWIKRRVRAYEAFYGLGYCRREYAETALSDWCWRGLR